MFGMLYEFQIFFGFSFFFKGRFSNITKLKKTLWNIEKFEISIFIDRNIE